MRDVLQDQLSPPAVLVKFLEEHPRLEIPSGDRQTDRCDYQNQKSLFSAGLAMQGMWPSVAVTYLWKSYGNTATPIKAYVHGLWLSWWHHSGGSG